jgi:hypothetical protein
MRRPWRTFYGVNRKGQILVWAIFGLWFIWSACVIGILKPPDWVMYVVLGMAILCGLIAAPHTEWEDEQ